MPTHSEPLDPGGETEGRAPVPPIDSIIGHWFAFGEVHIVFAEEGRQFYLLKETLERVYSNFLLPRQTWARRDEPTPLQGVARDEGILRAYHEAGHAVVCIAEGIKVEYVTITPHFGWKGERLLGFCQYDYRLPEALKHDCSGFAEKAAMGDLGGPWADAIYRKLSGLAVPDGVRYAWNADRSKARGYLAAKAIKDSVKVDLDQELERLSDAVATRLQEPWAWLAISRIAEMLCGEGAISGEVATKIVEKAKATVAAGGEVRTMIARLVSGGQAGVDRAALDAALELGIPCGGWCPQGRKAEDGPIPDHYPLVETPSSEYSERTRWNVRDSDGTLILAWGEPTGGTMLTLDECRKASKPYLVIDLSEAGDLALAVQAAREWVAVNLAGGVLNVAGPRGSEGPAVYDRTRAFLRALLGETD